MAGIGFVLRRLTRRDDLTGGAQAYVAAAAVTSGPWLLTVLAILVTEAWSRSLTGTGEAENFRAILSYNFCFSLVLTAPVMTVATRVAADRIFAGRIESLSSLFLHALGAAVLVQAPPVLLFWGLAVDLPAPLRLAAIANHAALIGLWAAVTFLSVLKDHALALGAVLAGMVVAAASAVAAQSLGALGQLGAFTLGATVITFVGGGRVLLEFPWQPMPWRDTWREARHFPVLALIGLVGAAAPWADKWVMWLSPGAERLDSGLRDYPAYDSAMFLAYLVMVPGIALFFVTVETEFFVRYRRYFDELLGGASLSRIEGLRRALSGSVLRSGVSLLLLETVVVAAAVLAGPALTEMRWLTAAQAPIFRLGVLGALFHTLMLCLMVVLAYLDVRRTQLAVVSVFLALNAALPALLLPLGDRYHGYGYFLAALGALLLAVLLSANALGRLNYHVFVANNPSLRVDASSARKAAA